MEWGRWRPLAFGAMIVMVENVLKHPRIVLSPGMISVYGSIQWEGDVVHLVAHWLTDPSAGLVSVGDRDAALLFPHCRGDEFHQGSPRAAPRGMQKPWSSVD